MSIPMRRSSRAAFAMFLGPVLAGTLTAQGQVLVVDPATPGAYATVQAAVDAAVSGDTVLVRDGEHLDSVTVDGKGLTIVGESAGGVEIGPLFVRNLAVSLTVCVSRIDLWFDSRVVLESNAGTVWIEECRQELLDLGSSGDGRPGISVVESARVVLVRANFQGDGSGASVAVPARAGLEVRGGSSVHAYDCTFEGGKGSWTTVWGTMQCQVGGAGVETLSASDSVFLSGSTARGGSGRYASQTLFGSDCSGGGAGVSAVGPVTVLDSLLEGGPGGINGTTSCAPAGVAYTGAVELLAGDSLAFSTGPLAREGEDVVYSFRGPPTTPVWLMGSPFARPEHLPTLHGTRLLGTPRVIDFMGVTDAAGALDVLVPLGLLPPTWDVRRVFLQPLMIEGARGGPGGKLRARPSRVTLGAGSAFLVLDNAF
jgi:hypothetical protein